MLFLEYTFYALESTAFITIHHLSLWYQRHIYQQQSYKTRIAIRLQRVNSGGKNVDMTKSISCNAA